MGYGYEGIEGGFSEKSGQTEIPWTENNDKEFEEININFEDCGINETNESLESIGAAEPPIEDFENCIKDNSAESIATDETILGIRNDFDECRINSAKVEPYEAVPGRHGFISEKGDGIVEAYEAVPGRYGFIESDYNTMDNVTEREFLSGEEMMEDFGVEQIAAGSDYFVKGNNFEQYESEYVAADEYEHISYDTPQEIEISPDLVEGIHLGNNEVQDSSVFWKQHETGGTAESFQEIASHILEVKEKLSNGATLDDVIHDSKLSKCASLYFIDKPSVYECDGYYEFSSNGRHRILAARSLGYDIPVKVVGRKVKR